MHYSEKPRKLHRILLSLFFVKWHVSSCLLRSTCTEPVETFVKDEGGQSRQGELSDHEASLTLGKGEEDWVARP